MEKISIIRPHKVSAFQLKAFKSYPIVQNVKIWVNDGIPIYFYSK